MKKIDWKTPQQINRNTWFYFSRSGKSIGIVHITGGECITIKLPIKKIKYWRMK